MTVDPKPELLPGDCLLYRPSNLIGWIIAIKTWNRSAVHVEIYAGGGMSFASRSHGVNIYPVRWEQLSYVLRPIMPCASPPRSIDLSEGRSWFYARAQGQKYDWLGLFCFYLAVKRGLPDRMFCSEFETRFYRKCGFHFVSDRTDADEVPPAQSFWSPAFDLIWQQKS